MIKCRKYFVFSGLEFLMLIKNTKIIFHLCFKTNELQKRRHKNGKKICLYSFRTKSSLNNLKSMH